MGKAGQRGGHKQVVLKSAGWVTQAEAATKAEKRMMRQLRPSQHQGWGLVGVTPLSRGVGLGPHPESCMAETGLPRRTAGPPRSDRDMGAKDRAGRNQDPNMESRGSIQPPPPAKWLMVRTSTPWVLPMLDTACTRQGQCLFL